MSMDEIRMQTRWETLASTARKIVPGSNDLETLVDLGASLADFGYSLMVLIVRLLLFLTFPLSVLLLYPAMRANHRRWFKWAQATEERRRAIVAEMARACDKSMEPWPDWKLQHDEAMRKSQPE